MWFLRSFLILLHSMNAQGHFLENSDSFCYCNKEGQKERRQSGRLAVADHWLLLKPQKKVDPADEN